MSEVTQTQVNFNVFVPDHILSLSSGFTAPSDGSVSVRELVRMFVESLTDQFLPVVNGKAVSIEDTIEIPASKVIDISMTPRRAPPPSVLDPLVDQLMKQTQRPAAECREALEKCLYDFSAAVEYFSET